MTRTFWLSFAGADGAFRGVAIVDVTEADAAAAAAFIAARFPHAPPGGEWIGAATRKAHLTGCNPGGDIQFEDMTECRDAALVALPRHVLLSKAQLEAAGVPLVRWIDES